MFPALLIGGARPSGGLPSAGVLADWNADICPNAAGVVSGNWIDQIGGKTLVPTAAPTYAAGAISGHAGITLNGITQYFTNTTLAHAQPFDVWLVIKQISWVINGRIVGMSSAGPVYAIIGQANVSPDVDLYAGSSAGINASLTLGNWFIIQCHLDGTGVATSFINVDNGGNMVSSAMIGNTGIVSGFMLGNDPQSSFLTNIEVSRLFFTNPAVASSPAIWAYMQATYPGA